MKILYTDGYYDNTDDIFVVVEFDRSTGRKRYGGFSLSGLELGVPPIMAEYSYDFFCRWVDGLIPYKKDSQLEEVVHKYLKEFGLDEEISEE